MTVLSNENNRVDCIIVIKFLIFKEDGFWLAFQHYSQVSSPVERIGHAEMAEIHRTVTTSEPIL